MSRGVFLLAAIFAGVAGIPVSGQWLNYPAAGRAHEGRQSERFCPRTPDLVGQA